MRKASAPDGAPAIGVEDSKTPRDIDCAVADVVNSAAKMPKARRQDFVTVGMAHPLLRTLHYTDRNGNSVVVKTFAAIIFRGQSNRERRCRPRECGHILFR